jgi:hypothetical protein
MPPVGLETTTSAGERQQTYALDHAANGITTAKTKNLKYYFPSLAFMFKCGS